MDRKLASGSSRSVREFTTSLRDKHLLNGMLLRYRYGSPGSDGATFVYMRRKNRSGRSLCTSSLPFPFDIDNDRILQEDALRLLQLCGLPSVVPPYCFLWPSPIPAPIPSRAIDIRILRCRYGSTSRELAFGVKALHRKRHERGLPRVPQSKARGRLHAAS